MSSRVTIASIDRVRPAARLHIPSRVLAWVVTGTLLALALAAGVLWQWQARAVQRVDIGSPLDDGAALNFHEREQSTAGVPFSFRWTYPNSDVRLWQPAAGPLLLELRMLAPPQPDGSQQVALTANGAPLASLALVPEPRRYRLLVGNAGTGDLTLGLRSKRLTLGGDPRELGVALDDVRLDALRPARGSSLFNELWSAPYLLPGLLLLVACTLLLRLPVLLIGGLPALTLGVLAFAGWALPEARLQLASYVVAFAAICAGALLVAATLRRVGVLWPSNDRRALTWIIAVFVVTVVIGFVPVIKNDGVQYYAYLRSLAINGDLQFADEYTADVFPQRPDVERMGRTATGHIGNAASVGPALAWTPMFVVAHGVALGGQALGLPWRADGFDPPYLLLIPFASAVAGLGGFLVCYHISRRWVGPAPAALAVVATLLGSNLFFYTMRQGSFAHALSATAAAVYVLTWLRLEERPTIGRWAALGAAAGALVLMYWISAFTLLLPVLTFVRLALGVRGQGSGVRGQKITARNQNQYDARLLTPDFWLLTPRKLWLGAIVAAAAFFALVSLQMLAWKVIYGAWIAVPHGGNYIQPREFKGLTLLFSHLYGLLPWTPAYFLGLIGLPLLWQRSRWLTLCLFVAGFAYFWYNASLARWFAGGAFGLRRMTVLTPWFVLGLALLFDALGRWRRALPFAVAALACAWMLMLQVRYDFFLIPHVPEEIEDMPVLAFYGSRETLPFWGIAGWLRGSYLLQQTRGLTRLPISYEFLSLLAVMIVSVTLVTLAARRFTQRAA